MAIMSAFLSPSLAMAPNNQGAAPGFLQDTLSQLVAGTCLLAVTTCISMWSAQRLIEQNIANIVKSDEGQTAKIERLQGELNALRIEQGILRGRVVDMGRRVGAP
jgi:hypothetical protein